MKIKLRLISFLLALTGIMMFCGCDDESNTVKGEYDYNKDCQLVMSENIPFFDNNIAKCDTGYYVLIGKKLYYVERKTMKATPLCNKPNCLHNDDDCNAIIGVVDNICYYDGSIYYLSESEPENDTEVQYLVKMSADGSQKENVKKFDFSIDEWIIHRGIFYYVKNVYDIDEETGIGNYEKCDCYIYALPVDGSKSEEKQIFFAEEIEKDAVIEKPMAYGNNLYFDMHGMSREDKNEYVNKTLKLNIDDLSISEMKSQDGRKLHSPMYLDGMLIFSCGENENGLYDYYKTDFDGNNPEKCLESYNGETLFCDGKYLYLDNYYALAIPSFASLDEPVKKDERYIKVYDSSFKKIDEFSLGEGSATTWGILPIDDEMFIFGGKNDNGDLIFYYDKSEFGTLGGKEWEKTFALKENG